MSETDPLADLYAEQSPGLTRWITTITRDPAAAEDVVQEAFLRLARELAAGREPDHRAAWVAQVARNLAISRARRTGTATRMAPRLAERATEDDPAVSVIAAERAEAVHRVLATLRPVERRAVLLAAEGVGGPEIALLIGRTHLATRALLCRARRRMRPALAELAETA
jgi:RNA polymerase sigma-70 factor (ECF subfamily)